MRMQIGLFGIARESNEEPFQLRRLCRTILFELVQTATDLPELGNIPSIDRGLEIEHPQFLVLSQKSQRRMLDMFVAVSRLE